MKRITLGALLVLCTCFGASAQSDNIFNRPYVEVSASADTMVIPDEIYISITISENDNKKLSVEDQEIRMAKAFKNLGIDVEKALSTSDMLSDFKSRFLRSKDVIKTKSYELKVHDAMMAGKVFAALQDLGIANSSISRVDYSKKDYMKDICRIQAIEKAKSTAEVLVKPLNQTVGKAIQIIDNNSTPVYNPGIRMFAKSMVAGANMDEAPKIEFEKIKISATENVKFSLN